MFAGGDWMVYARNSDVWEESAEVFAEWVFSVWKAMDLSAVLPRWPNGLAGGRR